jgi:hypothetical protein
VTGPNEKIILDGEKERQGDFVFTATQSGEYKFCFNNQMSTFAEKFVDFEIAVRLLFSSCPFLPWGCSRNLFLVEVTIADLTVYLG